jgi:tetratricopeptide (TPR) repeat protein
MRNLIFLVLIASLSMSATAEDLLWKQKPTKNQVEFDGLIKDVKSKLENQEIMTAHKKLYEAMKWSSNWSNVQRHDLEELFYKVADMVSSNLVRHKSALVAANFVREILIELPHLSYTESLYRKGAYLYGMAGNWVMAKDMTKEYLRKKSLKKYKGDMLYLLAVSLEQLGNQRMSKKAFKRLADHFPKHERSAVASSKVYGTNKQLKRLSQQPIRNNADIVQKKAQEIVETAETSKKKEVVEPKAQNKVQERKKFAFSKTKNKGSF